MLKLFEGALTLESLRTFSYKEACKFFDDSLEIYQHHQKESNSIKAQTDHVKKLSNKI